LAREEISTPKGSGREQGGGEKSRATAGPNSYPGGYSAEVSGKTGFPGKKGATRPGGKTVQEGVVGQGGFLVKKKKKKKA